MTFSRSRPTVLWGALAFIAPASSSHMLCDASGHMRECSSRPSAAALIETALMATKERRGSPGLVLIGSRMCRRVGRGWSGLVWSPSNGPDQPDHSMGVTPEVPCDL